MAKSPERKTSSPAGVTDISYQNIELSLYQALYQHFAKKLKKTTQFKTPLITYETLLANQSVTKVAHVADKKAKTRIAIEHVHHTFRTLVKEKYDTIALALVQDGKILPSSPQTNKIYEAVSDMVLLFLQWGCEKDESTLKDQQKSIDEAYKSAIQERLDTLDNLERESKTTTPTHYPGIFTAGPGSTPPLDTSTENPATDAAVLPHPTTPKN